MKTTHALIAGIAALALVAGGVTYSQSGGSRGEVSALAVSPGRDVSCSGNVPDSGGFTLDCEVLASQATPVSTTPQSSSSVTATPIASTTPSASPTVTARPSPSSTTAPTATRTFTPTAIAPTATSTATPIPTATPASGNNSVAAILDDSGIKPHDGAICNTGGFDWQFHAAQQGQAPNGFTQATGWGVINWSCGTQIPGVAVTIADFQAWVLDSSGKWTQINNSVQWCAGMNPQTSGFVTYNCDGFGGLGPTWQMPNSAIAIHWASNHPTIPAGTLCGLTMYRARYTGPGGARIMADAGFDWWQGSSIRSGGVGRYHQLTADWQWINFSTCTAAQLSANPPPLQ